MKVGNAQTLSCEKAMPCNATMQHKFSTRQLCTLHPNFLAVFSANMRQCQLLVNRMPPYGVPDGEVGETL